MANVPEHSPFGVAEHATCNGAASRTTGLQSRHHMHPSEGLAHISAVLGPWCSLDQLQATAESVSASTITVDYATIPTFTHLDA